MGLAQYNGSNPGNFETVYYAGSGTLTVGQLLAFSLDDTANPDSLPAGSVTVPPTSSVLPHDLRGRQVKDVDTTNNFAVAGVISDLGSLSKGVGPGWVTIQKPVKGDVVDIYTNASCVKNSTVLGSGTGGSNTAIALGTAGTLALATFGNTLALSIDTVDRSGTAGLARCVFK